MLSFMIHVAFVDYYMTQMKWKFRFFSFFFAFILLNLRCIISKLFRRMRSTRNKDEQEIKSIDWNSEKWPFKRTLSKSMNGISLKRFGFDPRTNKQTKKCDHSKPLMITSLFSPFSFIFNNWNNDFLFV